MSEVIAQEKKADIREEVTAIVQLVYDCSAGDALKKQRDSIHDDVVRLLDADSSNDVACCGVTIQHVSSEAATYGNLEARTLAERQSERILEALEYVYDIESPQELLTFALSDLRHFADINQLAFARCDREAFSVYQAERAENKAEPV